MIELIRENPKLVKESLKKRNMDPKQVDVLIELDKEWRKLKGESDELRAKRNKLSLEINALKKAGKDAGKVIKEAASIPDKLKKIDEEIKQVEARLHTALCAMPNMLHESVPAGKDSSENKVVKEFGKKPKFKFKPRNHVEILEMNDLADFDRATKISGARWYFLKNELAVLNLAIQRYAIDFMRERGYTFIIPPYFINRKSYEGVTSLDAFQDVLYKVEGEDLYAIATSEHPGTAAFAGEIFQDSNLPLKMVAFSTCFRKEAGAHGIDQKGIFRVHQFDKVEQLIISTPEKSWQMHEELIKNAIDFWKTLEIPFRQVVLCSGDTGRVSAKTYDFEAWFPSANTYREAGSCSNVTTWQSQRLGIKCETSPGVNRRLAHTLNSTCVAIQRCMAAILENFQNEDGTVTVPKVLQKYTGFKVIGKPAKK
ncbi:MAG: serine--tRNA ligase [Candidatus Woesearchaeota archaeon]